MAAIPIFSLTKGSDDVKDYICSTCIEQVDADFYCKQCLKCYCGKCIQLHGKRFNKHLPYSRNNMEKWPISKTVEESLLSCEVHNGREIEVFCDEHSQLCCMNCAFLNHSQCRKVTLISELPSTTSKDLQRLSKKLVTICGDIKTMQDNQAASMQSLQESYAEHVASVTRHMCLNINTSMEACHESTVSISDENRHYIKKSIISIFDEFYNSTAKELNEIKDEVLSIQGSITSSINKCIGLQNELTQFYEIIKKIGDHKELCLITSKKCERKIQQAVTLLGKSGKVFTIKGKYMHNLRIPSDSNKCNITCCCVLSDGKILVADHGNKKFKLLDQQYQMMSHYSVTYEPIFMCEITPSKVAVAVIDGVQFIKVDQTELIQGRKLELEWSCSCVAHHLGDLFICSHSSLNKYSLSGKRVCKLYKDAAGGYTVWQCAVSPTGDKLYIVNMEQDRLLTLARNGTVLATFTNQGISLAFCVHVTPAGQVLVCGVRTGTILQVDTEGSRKLATLATRKKDGLKGNISVCYSSITSSIIVNHNGHSILVLLVE